MTVADLLSRLAFLPDEASVPVGWVRERLEGVEEEPEPVVDLTVEDVAARLEKSPSTVRAMMPALERFGAYKLGREWRISPSNLRRYFDSLATSDSDREAPTLARMDDDRTTDLGAWRKEGS